MLVVDADVAQAACAEAVGLAIVAIILAMMRGRRVGLLVCFVSYYR